MKNNWLSFALLLECACLTIHCRSFHFSSQVQFPPSANSTVISHLPPDLSISFLFLLSIFSIWGLLSVSPILMLSRRLWPARDHAKLRESPSIGSLLAAHCYPCTDSFAPFLSWEITFVRRTFILRSLPICRFRFLLFPGFPSISRPWSPALCSHRIVSGWKKKYEIGENACETALSCVRVEPEREFYFKYWYSEYLLEPTTVPHRTPSPNTKVSQKNTSFPKIRTFLLSDLCLMSSH